MFTIKKKKGINEFVCDVSLYVVETPKASIKYHKPPLPIIPFGIVAYSFCWTTFLETAVSLHILLMPFVFHDRTESNKDIH